MKECLDFALVCVLFVGSVCGFMLAFGAVQTGLSDILSHGWSVKAVLFPLVFTVVSGTSTAGLVCYAQRQVELGRRQRLGLDEEPLC